MSIDQSDSGSLAVAKLDGQTQPESGSGQPQLMLAHFVEETRSVAQDHRNADETGYQTTLPKPRRPVKSVSIWSQSECRRHVLRRSDGEETLRIEQRWHRSR